MTLNTLKSLAEYWQRVLRLQDWDIDIVFGDKEEMGDSIGRVRPSTHRKFARIEILHPNDYDDTFAYKERDSSTEGIEHTVIHELLHIHFDNLLGNDRDLKTHHEEQLINVLASAYQKLNKGERPL